MDFLLNILALALMAVLDGTALIVGFGIGNKVDSHLSVLKVNVIGFCSLSFSIACVAFNSEFLHFSFLVSSLLLGMMLASFWKIWNE